MKVSTKRLKALTWGLGLAAMLLGQGARAGNEPLTIPLVLTDYYGWAYTEAFEDHADIFAWSAVGVDALGWGLFFTDKNYDTGLFFVNTSGLAKTLYPVVTLLGATDSMVRERAWIAVGTHTATLLLLEVLGQPALSVQTTMGPRGDGIGLAYAFKF